MKGPYKFTSQPVFDSPSGTVIYRVDGPGVTGLLIERRPEAICELLNRAWQLGLAEGRGITAIDDGLKKAA